MNKLLMMIGAAVVAIGAMLPLAARADLSCSLKGGTLTVTAPAAFAGKGLKLLWNKTDDGDASMVASWTNSADIVSSVSAEGGVYSIDLCACGITNGQPCKVASFTRYERLDMLKQDSYKSYITTEIVDTNVYGICFGYYSVATYGTWASCIGSYASNGGFSVHAYNSDRSMVQIRWRGDVLDECPSVRYADNASDDPDVAKINEFAFTNGVFSLNGDVVKSDLGSGVAVGTSNWGIGIGSSRYEQRSGGKDAMYGWWSHVSFDDASGNKIIDYIPAKRASDNVVGFYDRVAEKFVTATTGGFSAGTVTNATPVAAVNSRRTILCPTIPGLMIFVQ